MAAVQQTCPPSGLGSLLVQQKDRGLCSVMAQIFFFKFIYLWLCWVFISVRGLSLVASGGHSSSRCAGLSLSWPLLLQSTGSRRAGSVVVAHGPSCSAACGIFPDQGSNPCSLHWQADSQPLRHQGSPAQIFLLNTFLNLYFVSHVLSPFYRRWVQRSRSVSGFSQLVHRRDETRPLLWWNDLMNTTL